MRNPTASGQAPWTILKLLRWTSRYFQDHDLDSPRATAEILLAHTLDVRRIDLYLQYDQPLGRDELQRFKGLIRRRIAREPVAYIVGCKEFWSLELKVTVDVLIPRPETELLVEKALELLADPGIKTPRRVLELGTGSGAVILALAANEPRQFFFASDLCPAALVLARQNALRHHLDSRVAFFGGNWFQPLVPGRSRFDLIVSNPPYISAAAIDGLQPEVARFEPRLALDGGADGLASIGHIIRTAPHHLNSGGHLLLEIGHDQRSGIDTLASACGCYRRWHIAPDYSGHDRIAHLQVE